MTAGSWLGEVLRLYWIRQILKCGALDIPGFPSVQLSPHLSQR